MSHHHLVEVPAASELNFVAFHTLQVFDLPTSDVTGPPTMTYDPSWLAILRAFHPQLSLNVHQPSLPSDPTIAKAIIEKELAWVQANVPEQGKAEVARIQDFRPTAPFPGQPGGEERGPGKAG